MYLIKCIKLSGLILLFPFLLAAHAKADDYQTVRDRRYQILVGPANLNLSDPTISTQVQIIDNTGESASTSMEVAATPAAQTELWSDLIFPTTTSSKYPTQLMVDYKYSADMTASYTRLGYMALAYQNQGGAHYHDLKIRDNFIYGLYWLRTYIFKPNISPKIGNPWDWQMGSPLKLNDILVLMYADMPPEKYQYNIPTLLAPVAGYTKLSNLTGANLLWSSEVLTLSGVLLGDATQTQTGVAAAPSTLDDVNVGDGFFSDNSFIQHHPSPDPGTLAATNGVAYTGGYGTALLSDMADLITELAGTQWAFAQTTVDRESYLLLNALKPLIYKGEMQDSVRGRNISRYYNQSHAAGRSGVAVFLRHAASASPADATLLKQAAKYWLQTDTTFTPQTEVFDIYETTLAQSLLSDSSVTPMTEPTGMITFPEMDRAVFLRSGWGANLAMFSDHVYSGEVGNGDQGALAENLHGWYTGAGMLYIYDSDLNQHSDNYWPTVYPFHMDGVTALAGKTMGQQFGTSNFVGSLKSYGSAYGVAAMEIAPSTSPSSLLSGKKSWFFLANEIVCLGSDISSTASANIETTIVNRKISTAGTDLITTNTGTSQATPQTEPGTPYTASGITYLHIAGNTPDSGLGFYFPTPVTLNTLREHRGHSWTYINTGSSTENPTGEKVNYNNFYSAVINHGAAPNKASYAYAVLPHTTAAALASYASSPGFTVLSNTPDVQAVYAPSVSATGVVFWTANASVGTGASSITASAPSLVHVIRTGGKISITATDPTQVNTSSFTITFGSTATSKVTASSQITVNSLSPLSITINPNGLNGKAAYAQFTY